MDSGKKYRLIFFCFTGQACSCFIAVHVIKTKNRNHSMNYVKNLGYDKLLIYKQPRQESGLCCFSFAPVICRSVSPKFIELCFMGDHVCAFGGILLSKRKVIALEI